MTWIMSKRCNRADLEVLSNFSDKPLEGELPDKKLSALLVLTDLTVPTKEKNQ
jgi:hypothetical protein